MCEQQQGIATLVSLTHLRRLKSKNQHFFPPRSFSTMLKALGGDTFIKFKFVDGTEGDLYIQDGSLFLKVKGQQNFSCGCRLALPW